MIQNTSKKSSTVLEVRDYADGLFQDAVNRATSRLVVNQLKLTADLVEAHERIAFLEEEITAVRDVVSKLVLKEKSK